MIKLVDGGKYFISESKTEKVYIPKEVRDRIYDIIRDESIDEYTHRDIDEEEIQTTVDFIMSEITDILSEEKYLIIRTDKNG